MVFYGITSERPRVSEVTQKVVPVCCQDWQQLVTHWSRFVNLNRRTTAPISASDNPRTDFEEHFTNL